MSPGERHPPLRRADCARGPRNSRTSPCRLIRHAWCLWPPQPQPAVPGPAGSPTLNSHVARPREPGPSHGTAPVVPGPSAIMTFRVKTWPPTKRNADAANWPAVPVGVPPRTTDPPACQPECLWMSHGTGRTDMGMPCRDRRSVDSGLRRPTQEGFTLAAVVILAGLACVPHAWTRAGAGTSGSAGRLALHGPDVEPIRVPTVALLEYTGRSWHAEGRSQRSRARRPQCQPSEGTKGHRRLTAPLN